MKNKLLKWLLTAVAAAAFSIPSSAQISISAKDRTVSEVLPEIEKQGNFKFFYSSELPDLDTKVSVSVSDKDIRTVLDNLFSGLRIAYDIKSPKLVVLSAKNTEGAKQTSPDKKKVIGTVYGSDGLPAIGMTVIEAGTSNGTVTDADGNYSIVLTTANPVLRYESLGYRTVTETVGGRSRIDITVEVEAIALDEVIAIGYGTAKKRDLTTAISTISNDDMTTRPITDAARFIQGKVAGVTAQQTSGMPGSGMTIRVRGASSIASSNDPLYVVDGVPVGDPGSD